MNPVNQLKKSFSDQFPKELYNSNKRQKIFSDIENSPFWSKLCKKCRILESGEGAYRDFISAVDSKNPIAQLKQVKILCKWNKFALAQKILFQVNLNETSLLDSTEIKIYKSKMELLNFYFNSLDLASSSTTSIDSQLWHLRTYVAGAGAVGNHHASGTNKYLANYQPEDVSSARLFFAQSLMHTNEPQFKAADLLSAVISDVDSSDSNKMKAKYSQAIDHIKHSRGFSGFATLSDDQCFNYFKNFYVKKISCNSKEVYQSPVRQMELIDAILGMLRLVASKRASQVTIDQAFEAAESCLKDPFFINAKNPIPEAFPESKALAIASQELQNQMHTTKFMNYRPKSHLLYSYPIIDWLKALQLALYNLDSKIDGGGLVKEENKLKGLALHRENNAPDLETEKNILGLLIVHNDEFAAKTYIEIASSFEKKELEDHRYRELLAICVLHAHGVLYHKISNEQAFIYIEKILKNSQYLSSADATLALSTFIKIEKIRGPVNKEMRFA